MTSWPRSNACSDATACTTRIKSRCQVDHTVLIALRETMEHSRMQHAATLEYRRQGGIGDRVAWRGQPNGFVCHRF